MARDILDQAPFLSPGAPRESIVDYSGSLGSSADRHLETFAQNLNFKAKVVVLPSDFSPGSMSAFDSFCRDLAQKWHVSGDRFLLVVDLKGHHVRGLSGKSLQSDGIDSSFISVLIRDEFVPRMKQGDLSDAIQNTLAGVQNKLTESKATLADSSLARDAVANPVSSTRVPQDLSATSSGPSLVNLGFAGLFVLIALLVAFTMLTLWLQKSQRAKRIAGQSQKMFEQLKVRLASLYEKTDVIGQAAEYLNPNENGELAKEVADFFNRVGALSATQDKLESMKKKGNLSESYDQLRKIEKMVGILEPESDKLLSSVNVATGGKALIAESPEAVAMKFEQQAELAVQKDKDAQTREEELAKIQRRREEERFRRPAWSYEPTYYGPVVYSDPWANLSNWMLMLNQMQLEDRVDRMDYDMHHRDNNYDSNYPSRSSNYGDGGGSWGSDAGSSWGSDSGSSWADSGGDSGGWDSGGDSGGGDGGGSW